MNAKQEFAIADFAESLLLDAIDNPSQAFSRAESSIDSSVPDISDIEISENTVSKMLGTENHIQEEERVEVSQPEERLSLEEIVSLLIKEVTNLKEQISEITSCGSIGTGHSNANPRRSSEILKRLKRRSKK